MNLSDFQAMGALVPMTPIKREVKVKKPVQRPKSEWADPSVPEFTGAVEDATITIHVRRGAAIDAIEMMRAEDRLQPFVAIYRSVVMPDGSPVFESLEQASQLATWIAFPLFEAITEVAGAAPKGSRRKTSGGSKPASPTASP